jgi:NADPH:quinone reductase
MRPRAGHGEECVCRVLAGKITSEPTQLFPLEQANEVHPALESRAATGATVLVP